eukprot:scaffold118542_cov36-Tisochrysis_lutea.AAC.2
MPTLKVKDTQAIGSVKSIEEILWIRQERSVNGRYLLLSSSQKLCCGRNLITLRRGEKLIDH